MILVGGELVEKLGEILSGWGAVSFSQANMEFVSVAQVGVWLPWIMRIIVIESVEKKFRLSSTIRIATVIDNGFHEEFHDEQRREDLQSQDQRQKVSHLRRDCFFFTIYK